MPIVGKFYGLIILMNYINDEHNPPHIHVLRKDECEAVFDIKTGRMIRGYLPTRYEKYVKSFIEKHKERLLEMWKKQNFEILSLGD